MLRIENRTELVIFVLLASLAAVSASCILASVTYDVFRPFNEQANLLNTIFISSLTSVPIAIAMAVHSMRVTQYQSELEELANTDGLTGLHNRRRFLELLPDERDPADSAVIAFVDLDRFKSINDRFGHAVGDEVVRTLADRLQAFRPAMDVARLGGDEFALVLRLRDSSADAGKILDSVRAEISRPVASSAGPINVGASIGAAWFSRDGSAASELLRAADRAMMRAKSQGGGVCWFDADIDAETTAETEIESQLLGIIASGGITPVYQPVACARSAAIVGHEVLARWTAPGFAEPPGPGRFVPIAERAGLVDAMFWSLLEQVLKGPAAGAPHGVIALNVSPLQLQFGGFSNRLESLLSRHRFDPHRLELEVTETAMFRDMDTGIETLRQIADQGVSIALDDFGTGHSSLSLVRQLPLSKLKIDQSFISSLNWSSHSESIVSATIGLCRALDLTVCAEGVEDARTRARITELGCDLVQGNLLGHPDPTPLPCEARKTARPVTLAPVGGKGLAQDVA